MKKISLLSIVILATVFTSCKKDYKCSCVTSPGSTPAQVTTMVGVTKNTAKNNCVSSKWTNSTGTEYTETCTLS